MAMCCGERLICIFMVESVELLLMTIGLEKAFVKLSSKGSRKTIANGEYGEKQMFH